MNRRHLLLAVGGTSFTSASGCLGWLEDDTAMELIVLNYEEDQVDARLTIAQDDEVVFERDATYAANIDEITEINYGHVVEDAIDSRYTIEGVRHDNDRSVSQDVYLTCSPEHRVVITLGWDADEIDVEDSTC